MCTVSNGECTTCKHKLDCLFDSTNICFLTEYDEIDKMSRIEMASLIRFATPGHKYFRNDYPLNMYFMDKWYKIGGMSPEISKEIGWNK
jgi:hypothetical protein